MRHSVSIYTEQGVRPVAYSQQQVRMAHPPHLSASPLDCGETRRPKAAPCDGTNRRHTRESWGGVSAMDFVVWHRARAADDASSR